MWRIINATLNYILINNLISRITSIIKYEIKSRDFDNSFVVPKMLNEEFSYDLSIPFLQTYIKVQTYIYLSVYSSITDSGLEMERAYVNIKLRNGSIKHGVYL